ncbi:hypothetical protein CEX98_07260 [Pseudoalteromonas piscicida]|uniref:Glycosyltransferase 2-like domain-containing protein n=1 Tax=Pseudoalteromonas piscicida TaxID=43662 RepID=A0A2A5JT20_PSEO7|nr:hypothetical protein [Pseudoalteromonas piscicida]PCK32421.1 hypothetical protein CEX98_07260 [Pseudoalteromonas piscicida]
MLVDDDSLSVFDYRNIADEFKCLYLKNDVRKGVAKSRDIGVSLATTQNVFLLDAHMKFYCNGWDVKIEERLQNNPTTIYSTVSVVLNEKWERIPDAPEGFGAYISDFPTCEKVFDFKWLTCPASPSNKIPLIMGAAYAFNREYYLKLRGLTGLQQWGMDEQYLSIKSYLAGGYCEVIPDIKVGHVYRKQLPYKTNEELLSFNRIFVLSVLMTEAAANNYLEEVKDKIPSFRDAYHLITKSQKMIDSLRSYYLSNFPRTFDDYLLFNDSFQRNLVSKNGL